MDKFASPAPPADPSGCELKSSWMVHSFLDTRKSVATVVFQHSVLDVLGQLEVFDGFQFADQGIIERKRPDDSMTSSYSCAMNPLTPVICHKYQLCHGRHAWRIHLLGSLCCLHITFFLVWSTETTITRHPLMTSKLSGYAVRTCSCA